MLPKKVISLLICCSLILGAFSPLNTLSSSENSTDEPPSFTLRLNDIVSSLVVSATASAKIVDGQSPEARQTVYASIAYGETVAGEISVAGEQDSYQFNGEAGDLVFAYINSPLGAEFYLEMHMPGGSVRSCFSYESCLIDNVTLPATGVYSLIVGGSGIYTGDYSLTLGTPEPISMSIGDIRNIAVTSLKPMTYQFEVPSGTDNLFVTLQKVGIWVWNSDLELSRGSQLIKSSSSLNDQILQIPAPAAGTYYLKITGTGEGKLAVRDSLPDLPLGEWVTGTIYTQFGLAWYQIDVPAGQDSLNIYVEMLGLMSLLDVYQDSIIGTPDWSASGATMNLEIPSPAAGRYYVQLTDSAYVVGDSQARDHLIKADVVPIDPTDCAQPVVTNFTPTIGGTSMPVSVTVTGQCFQQDSSVCLRNQDFSEVCADPVFVADDGRSINATFDLSYAQPGEWSLTVTNLDGQSTTAQTPFTVQSGGEPNLWVEILGRAQIREGRTTSYFVKYGNAGNVNFYDAILLLKVPSKLEVALPGYETADDVGFPIGVELGGYTQIPIWLIGINAGSQQEVRLDLRVPEDSSLPLESEIEIFAEIHTAPRSQFSATGNPDYLNTSPTFQNIRDSSLSAMATYGYPTTPSQAMQFEQALLGVVLDRLKSNATSLVTHLLKGALLAFGFPVAAQVLAIGATIYSFLGWVKNIADPNSPYRKLASFLLKLISSISPEDKFGPAGYDPPGTALDELQRWIPPSRPLNYRIDFWNKEDAPAATVDVIITDTLDTDLDWNSFYFTEIGFLDWQVELQPTQSFNVDVSDVSIDLSDYYPGEPVVDMVVNVEGTYDSSSGYIEWHFHALDPATRQPPENPYAGFLPPITSSGWEIGWVEFSVAQKQNLASGTVIENQAFVKFDLNEFKPAPKEGPFTNTVDGTPPTSTAQIPAGNQNCNGILVTWTGQDEQKGSGLDSFDLYVNDGGTSDPAYLWRGGLQSNWAIFSGEPGIAYMFYTRARDNAGNLESAPQSPDYDDLAGVYHYCLFVPMGMSNYGK